MNGHRRLIVTRMPCEARGFLRDSCDRDLGSLPRACLQSRWWSVQRSPPSRVTALWMVVTGVLLIWAICAEFVALQALEPLEGFP